jgi:hypothetical protein
MVTPHPTLKKNSDKLIMKDIQYQKRETDLAPPMPKRKFSMRCFNNLPHEANIAESLKENGNIFLFSYLKEHLRRHIILFYRFSYLAYFYKYFDRKE